MEAATKERELSGDKAQRIVDAMRDSVARRGAAGSTFDVLDALFGAEEEFEYTSTTSINGS